MIAFFIILSVLIVLVLIYFLFLVRPYNKEADKVLLCDYAHRGLHNESIPENSLFAFEAAASKGFGMELDIQLSKDKAVMVFHDYNLKRMTGLDKKLNELTVAELKELSLKETNEKIPTLKEVLELVDGRMPILVEIKGEDFNYEVCEKAAEILKDYKGPYCLESFNPFLIGKMGKLLPHSFRGLLYTNYLRGPKVNFIKALGAAMALNFIAKPNFISYNKLDRNSLPVNITTKLYRTYKFVWTVVGGKEISTAKGKGEFPIFEKPED